MTPIAMDKNNNTLKELYKINFLIISYCKYYNGKK